MPATGAVSYQKCQNRVVEYTTSQIVNLLGQLACLAFHFQLLLSPLSFLVHVPQPLPLPPPLLLRIPFLKDSFV